MIRKLFLFMAMLSLFLLPWLMKFFNWWAVECTGG